MKKDIHYQAMPEAKAGWVYLCGYCGEGISKGKKLCSQCKTRKDREEILEANKRILKQLRKKGYCLDEILLPVA